MNHHLSACCLYTALRLAPNLRPKNHHDHPSAGLPQGARPGPPASEGPGVGPTCDSGPMIEVVWAVGGLIVGAVVAYAVAVARSSTRTEAVANKRAEEREARVREEAERRIADLKEQFSQVQDQFKALSADVLDTNSRKFLQMANERFTRSAEAQAAELAKREQAVKSLVEPMSKALEDVKRQTSEAEKFRREGQAQLREQVEQVARTSERLGERTKEFINTLRRSDVRGNWGQVQLERVVELAGMVEHVDFETEVNVRDDEGKNLRPDLTVNLAGGRTIVVDAKVAVLALIEAFDTDDERVRAERLEAHAKHVRKHIDDLASKRYWDQFSSAPEFVVMFVPSEAFYQAAVEQDATLQEYAFSKNVMIATPTTLVAMLRTVAHAWKEDKLAKNAQLVLATGKELYDRLVTMGSHLAKVGRALDSAGKAYNATVASMESRVLVSARKFGEMQEIRAELESPEQAQLDIREIAAPELTEDD